jgi:hypothetical protein
MANRDGEAAQATQDRVIAWLGFAYAVAAGAIPKDAQVSQLSSPIREAFADEPWLTVHKLFKPRSRMKNLSLQQLALGSMLHLVQDSYAASHARREAAPSVRCPNGRITQFLSYLHQQTDRHRAEDKRSALDYRGTLALQNPVEASARLILLARRRSDWDTVVEPYLRSRVFCLDSDAERSGPGTFHIPPIPVAESTDS